MSPSASFRRGWNPLVECRRTQFFIAPGTKQRCKEKYKQARRNSLRLRVWGHPRSRGCAPQLTGVRHIPVHLSAAVKKITVPSAERRDVKHYSECFEQVATGCGSGRTGLSALPDLPSLTATCRLIS